MYFSVGQRISFYHVLTYLTYQYAYYKLHSKLTIAVNVEKSIVRE